jgi:dienelactone hydrolase
MRPSRALPLLLASAVVWSLNGLARAATPVVPPPLEAYGKLEAMDDLQLSQDGKLIAYIAAVGDDHVFVIKRIDGPILQTVAANHRKTVFIQFADPDHVLMGIRGTEHVGGDMGNVELFAVIVYNLKTHKGAQIYPRDGVAANPGPPVAVSHQGSHVYGYFLAGADSGADSGGVAADAGQGDQIGLYKTDLDTLVSSLEVRGGAHATAFAVGPGGEVLARTEEFDHGKSWRVMKGADGGQVFATGKTEWGNPEVTAYGRSKASIILKGSDDGDFNPPREIDLATGIASAPLIDGATAEPLRDRGSRLTIGLRVGGFVNDAVFFDPALDAKWQSVKAAFPDEEVTLASYDDAFDRWVVRVEGPHDSGRYFLVDLTTAKATWLGAIYPQIKPDQVAAFRWYDYTAQDGTKLKGVLTLPPGRDPKNLPLVMMPHGGPGNGTYDSPHFDWWAQAIASRGYAVFQPDYRGSGGLGKSFERAGWGKWGRLMETDVSDAIPALAADGLIDPKRVCIVGWSYGGYATLAGVTIQNGLYRCAAAGGAVADLNDMMSWVKERGAGRLDPISRYWSDAMGLKSDSDPSGALWSPDKQASHADAPILLIHGKDDTVVPIRQAEMMSHALRSAGKTVELTVLPTSDHWIGNGTEANRVAMLKAMVGWLEKYDPPQ